jgi:hypothetical protein
LGCRIVRAEARLVVLEQCSRLLTAHNVVVSGESGVRWATFVTYERPIVVHCGQLPPSSTATCCPVC